MKKLVSTMGDSEITVIKELKAGIKVEVTRQLIDRHSGVIKTVTNERVVPRSIWRAFTAAYEPSTP